MKPTLTEEQEVLFKALFKRFPDRHSVSTEWFSIAGYDDDEYEKNLMELAVVLLDK